MLLKELQSKKELIEQFARARGARRIRVFGSVARGEENDTSDIDFLVDFPAGYDLFTQRMALAEELSEVTGRKIDLVPEHELNRHFLESVLKESVYL